VEIVFGQILARDDREDARDGEGFRRLDLLDGRVGEWTPHDIQIEHAGQLDVVHVRALAADEARVFLALY
jgi:hypothetical protein